MDIILDISKKLDSFFNRKGLTAYRIAKITGLSEPTINRYRQGKSKPTIKNLHKLFSHFDGLEEYLNINIKEVEEEKRILGNASLSAKDLNITLDAILNHEEELMKNKVFKQWYENKMLIRENKLIREFTERFNNLSK